MNTKGLKYLGFVATLALVSSANAVSYLNGSFGAVELGTNGSAFTATTLQLDSGNNLIRATETGDFITQVPAFSDLTAYTLNLAGIGATPTAESIANYFVFSSPDPLFGTPGTTPINRFEFNLASIQSIGNGMFTGSGTIVDTKATGAFADTQGNFIVTFSSPANAPRPQGNYSLTFNALGVAPVPEPASISLFGVGLLWAWLIRRRKV